MTIRQLVAGLATAVVVTPAIWAADGAIKGTVTGEDGKPLGGVMVSAFDEDIDKSISVFTRPDGSFEVDGLADKAHLVRARLIGLEDEFVKSVPVDGDTLNISMEAADAEELQLQRRGTELLPFLKFDNEEDKQNFKMMCMYCHQTGTIGFRTPEEPVDWETMVTRMQGFGGLYKHTQETLVSRLLEAYSEEAIAEWPPFEPPAPPSGKEIDVVITEWAEGEQDNCMIHDLELGKDGRMVYTVDMTNDSIMELDTVTGEQKTYAIPGGKEPGTPDNPRKGPHSIEPDAEGNMWITLALSGQMAKFDVTTKEFTQVSGHPERPRGAYPHSLRVDKKDVVWYTDAGTNSVFALDPSKNNEIREYRMLSRDQAVGGGRGESGGITPYGIAIAPNGFVWASKLNGNRVVKIDPDPAKYEAVKAEYDKHMEAGDREAAQKAWEAVVTEYVPPFTGPRRLHVSQIDGKVWVPAFANGTIGRFDPETEEWKMYDMPDAENDIPYALNIHPQTNEVWVCGTGSDTMMRLIPETGEVVTYRMPTRVTYTREIEFHPDGSVWACNSNYPPRHIENGRGSVIRIEVDSNEALPSTD